MMDTHAGTGSRMTNGAAAPATGGTASRMSNGQVQKTGGTYLVV